VKRVYFKTFGCRTNLFDSAVMMSKIRDFEIVEQESEADIIVINSCTVTSGADSTTRSYINAQQRANKEILLTGCGAQTEGKKLFESRDLKAVFGLSHKKEINSILKSSERMFDLGDLEFIDDSIVSEFRGKSRAFIKIQEGCSFECSYCIIPHVRGAARSIDEKIILEQIKILSAQGFSEFVLTGTNIGSFRGSDGSSIAKLLKSISAISGVKRVRLGSLEPSQIDDEFREILSESWLERHLHIALQHTSKQMLHIMKRRNKFSSDIELFEQLSEAGFALGTDFIVAHPGESEAIWSEAYENLTKLPLTHIHAFTYSAKSGTLSAKMAQKIDGKSAKKRLAQVVDLVAKKSLSFRQKHTTNLDILVESSKNGVYLGYDQYFNKIEIQSSKELKGSWVHIDSATAKKEINHATI